MDSVVAGGDRRSGPTDALTTVRKPNAFRDPYSPFKLVHHMDRIRQLRDGLLISPLKAEIDPTNRCNQNCGYCPYRAAARCRGASDQREELSLPVVVSLLDSLRAMGTEVVTLTGGGEPLFHPQTGQILEAIHDRGFGLALITNGVLVEDEFMPILSKADWIRVSIDTIDPERYELIRGVDRTQLEVVKANMVKLVQSCENTMLGASVLINRCSLDTLEETVKYLKNIGVHNVRIRMANDPDSRAFYEEHRAEIERELDKMYTHGGEDFKVYVMRDPRVLQPHHLTRDGHRRCGLQHFSVAVAADGHVYPCCVLKGRHWARMGSVREKSLEDIWHGERRRAWLGKQTVGTHCRLECMYDTVNMLFTYLYYGDDTHSCYV